MKTIEIPVSQLTADELKALEGTLQASPGMTSVKVEVPEPEELEAAQAPAFTPPPPSPEVAARLKEIKELQQTFSKDGSQFNPGTAGLPEVVDDNDADKNAFLAHILGADRFKKTYSYFNGRLVLVMQTLMLHEDELVVKQISADIAAKRLATPEDVLRQVAEYKMMLCLSEIRRDGKFEGVRSVTQYPVGDEATALPAMLDEFKRTMPLYLTGLIRKTHDAFQKLCLELYEAADKPDFW